MINNKIGGRNMVGRAVNRLAGRLTAVALTAAMAVSMLAGCAAGGKNTEMAAKKEYLERSLTISRDLAAMKSG